MNSPLVSIIIPTYNYAKFISETLQSIKNQTYNNWEAIIVDDGSTDNIKDVVKSFLETDKRIKYIYQNNKGLPAARNTGINACEGFYIQLLDADDLISTHKIELQVSFMQENPKSDICYTTAHYFKDPIKAVFFSNINLSNKPWIPKLNGSGEIILQQLIKFNIMPVNSALIKRDLFNTVGYQNEDFKRLEDWEFWLRCAFGGAIFNYVENEKAFALIRVHAVSMSQKKDDMLKWQIHLNSIINSHINNSLIKKQSKENLLKLNYLAKKRLFKEDIVRCKLFNFDKIKSIHTNFSFFELCILYISAVNEKRKLIKW